MKFVFQFGLFIKASTSLAKVGSVVVENTCYSKCGTANPSMYLVQTGSGESCTGVATIASVTLIKIAAKLHTLSVCSVTEKIKSRNQSGGSENVLFSSRVEYIFRRLTNCCCFRVCSSDKMIPLYISSSLSRLEHFTSRVGEVSSK